jgi:hypothetical protein
MANNWLTPDLLNKKNQQNSNWWEDASTLDTPTLQLGDTAFGQRIGSYRQLNQAQQQLARQQALQQIGGLNGLQQVPANFMPTNLTPSPSPAGEGSQNAEAPWWMAAPETGLGQYERRVVKPGGQVDVGAALGGALEGVLRGLGSLAQGAESVIGQVTQEIPQLDVSGPVQGKPLVQPSLAQRAREQAAKLQQTLGQDYTQKYRVNSADPFRMVNAQNPTEWALTQASNIAYSGIASDVRNNAQQRALARILTGEDPGTVLRGMEAPAEDAYADQQQLWQTRVTEYMDSMERQARAAALQAPLPAGWSDSQTYANAMATQARGDAGAWVNATGRIPGEESPWPELIGQVIIDPLNLPGAQALQEKLFGRVVEAGKGIVSKAAAPITVYDNAMAKQVKAITSGIGTRAQALGDKLAASTNPVAKVLNAGYQKGLKLAQYTPETSARVLAGTTYEQLGNVLADAQTGAEAAERLKLFVEDPAKLTVQFGAVPVSVSAEVARPVVKDTYKQLSKLPSLRADEFNIGAFLKEADEINMSAAEKLAGVNRNAVKPAWQRWSQAAKSWMSEFYLKTPGYVIRNFLSDNSIATMDGLRMFENMDNVTRELEQFGVTSRRMGQGIGNLAEDIGYESKLAKIPGIGDFQTKVSQIADKGEKARYTRAYWSALTDAFHAYWAPELSEDVVRMFGEAGRSDLVDAMEAGLKQARSGKDVRRVMNEVLNSTAPAERFYVTQFIEAGDLPHGLATEIEANVRKMYQDGRSGEEVGAYLDEVKGKISDFKRGQEAIIGDVFSPRATTELDAAQDITLEREQPYANELAARVNAGEITKEESAQMMATKKAQWTKEQQEITAARKAMRDAFGQSANPDQYELAAAMHGVDGESEIREGTRISTDQRRKAEWQKDPHTRDWPGYFNEQDATWSKGGQDTVARYGESQKALEELRELGSGGAGGADTAAARQAVLDKYGIKTMSQRAEEALNRTRAEMETLGEEFDKALRGQRANWDAARAESRRQLSQMMNATPELGQDGLDLFISTERDVQRRFDQAIGAVSTARQEMLADKISPDEYRRIASEEWGKAFDYATNWHGQALQERLANLEIGRGQIAARLKAAGVPEDEAAQLLVGLRDGSTRDEVQRILSRGAGERLGVPSLGSTGAQAVSATALAPPATVDELVSQFETPQEALDHARQMEQRASLGVGERLGVPSLGSTGATSPLTPPRSGEGNQAAEQWRKLGDELQARVNFQSGMQAEEAAHRQLVRDVARREGIGAAAEQIRTVAAGNSELNAAMRDELAQIARERAINVLDGAEDVTKAYGQVERGLGEVLFSTSGDVNGIRIGDAAAEAKALEAFRQAHDIPVVAGLERERSVDTIRALATELGLDPDELVRGERGVNEIIDAARAKDSALVDRVLAADTVHADGRIKAKDWQELGIEGERRTPGTVLKEMGTPTPNPSPGVPGEGIGAIASSGNDAEALPEEVRRAEELVAKRKQQLKEARAAYAQGHTPAQATAVQDAEARAKTAGIQASEARKKYGVKAPSLRGSVPGVPGMGAGESGSAGASTGIEERTGQVTRQVSNVTTATGADPNKAYRFRYRVVSLDELTPSHLDNLSVNPAFPEGLQPRLRDRAASQMQVDSIAQGLNPDALLEDTHQIDRGSPIIGSDRVVESGNGRTLALRRARTEYPEQWNAYQARMREKLPEFGLTEADLQGVKDPVLVRERLTDVERAQFAQEANSAGVLGMSPVEQAATDATRISGNGLSGLVIGENQSIDQALLSSANKDLVSGFLGMVPANERAALVDGAGRLNQAGLTRLKAALFARTYPGAAGQRLTQAFFESLDPTVRNIQNGMMASLPAMARAEAQFATGARDASLSIADDVAAAVDRLAQLKQSRMKVADYLAQTGMFGEELTPNQRTLLAWFDEHARSPKAVREFLNGYADEIDKLPAADQMTLFAGAKPTKEGILNGLTGRTFTAEAVAETGDELAGAGAGVAGDTGRGAAAGNRPGQAGGGATAAGGGTDSWSAEQQYAIDEHVSKHGNNEPLGVEQKLTADEKHQLEAIDKIKAGLVAGWGTGVDSTAVLPKGARQAVEAEIKRLMPSFYEARAQAVAHAGARADFSMLDYGMKRGFDTYVTAFSPYYYWGSRQGRNYAIRAMEKPQYLVNYMRYKDATHKVNQQRGTRSRFEGGIEIPLGNDTSAFIDPLSFLFPFANIVNIDSQDAGESKSTLAQVYDMASALGLRPGPWIDVPLRWSNVMVSATPGTPEYEQQIASSGKGSIGGLIPQLSMLKGATALAGVGPAGGIDVERGIRQAAGLPEAQPYETYVVARSVRDLATEAQVAAQKSGGQVDNQPYLLAQALIASAGDASSGMGWGALLGGQVTPGAIAQQYGTDAAQAQAALGIVQQAANRSAQQKGISTLASGLGGVSLKVQPAGEKYYNQMAQMEKGAAYNAATGVGSKEAVTQVRQANPALAVGRAQYSTLPGDTRDPAQQYTIARRDAVNAQFDALKDAVIQQMPWNRDAAFTVEDGRAQALANLSPNPSPTQGGASDAYTQTIAKLMGGSASSASSGTYTPRSIVGASPAEAMQVRKDEIMRMVYGTRPQFAQFDDGSGVPDYAGYRAAVDAWEKNLTGIAARLPLVQHVVNQVAGESGSKGAEEFRQFLTGIRMEDVQAYQRRNDSPIEAAQRAWYDAVYDPAMDAARSKGGKVNARAVRNVGATDTEGLIKLVQQVYGDKWSADELRQALSGMSMPDVQTVYRNQMTATSKAKADAQDAFDQVVLKKWKQRGLDALTAYDTAQGAEAKAKVRARFAQLPAILRARTTFMQDASQ